MKKVILFLFICSPALAWHFGEPSATPSLTSVVCNNGLKQTIEKKVSEDVTKFCFVSYFEKEESCFPSLEEAASAACRSAGTL